MTTKAYLVFAVVLRTAFAVVLVNAPFWWMEQSQFLNRGFFGLDSLIALSVMVVQPLIGRAVLVLAWIFDAVVAKSLTYHFQSPLDFIASARFASTIDWVSFFEPDLISLILPFVVAMVLLPLIIGNSRSVLPFLFAVLLGLAVLDALNGTSRLSTTDQRHLPSNIAGSPALTLSLSLIDQINASSLRQLPESETAAALVNLPEWANEHPEGRVLLVVVESMGAPMEPMLQAYLDSLMHSKSHQTQISKLPFRGSTTSAELRILCGLLGHYSKLKASDGSRCLPAQLNRQGWSTIGMHGFSASMFDRKVWWPLSGLQQLAFVDSPFLDEAGRCGTAFSGACDSEVLDAAGRWLQEGESRFAYVLTLNTHLPIGTVTVPPDLQQICETNKVDIDACQLVSGIGKVLNAIIRVVEHSRKPTLALVIGDHAPPFNSLQARLSFSQQVTPAYVLRPNYSD